MATHGKESIAYGAVFRFAKMRHEGCVRESLYSPDLGVVQYGVMVASYGQEGNLDSGVSLTCAPVGGLETVQRAIMKLRAVIS